MQFFHDRYQNKKIFYLKIMRPVVNQDLHTGDVTSIVLKDVYDFVFSLVLGIVFAPLLIGFVIIYLAWLQEFVVIRFDRKSASMFIQRHQYFTWWKHIEEKIQFKEIEEIQVDADYTGEIGTSKVKIVKKDGTTTYISNNLLSVQDGQTITKILSEEFIRSTMTSASLV